jgi:RNA polymerase sigma-70 factor (ECF subfamily)
MLADLPDRYRAPIVLRYVDDFSISEIAQVLGRPEGTVKAQVHRGLALLRAAHEAAEREELSA